MNYVVRFVPLAWGTESFPHERHLLNLKRVLALLILPFASLLVLAGCMTPAPSNNSDDKKDDKDSSDVRDADEDEEEDSDAPADGELAEPGTRVGIDEWLTHSFTS